MIVVGKMRQRAMLTEENHGNPKQVEARKEEVGTTLFIINITHVELKGIPQTIPSSYQI
jgi:hypothetical protein